MGVRVGGPMSDRPDLTLRAGDAISVELDTGDLYGVVQPDGSIVGADYFAWHEAPRAWALTEGYLQLMDDDAGCLIEVRLSDGLVVAL